MISNDIRDHLKKVSEALNRHLPRLEALPSYSKSKKNCRREIVDGSEIFVIGLSDLIANKSVVDCSFDKDDLEYLKNLQKEK